MTGSIEQIMSIRFLPLAFLSILASGCFGSPSIIKIDTKTTIVAAGENRVAKDGSRFVIIDISSPRSYDDLESDPLLADEADIPATQSDGDSWSRLDDGIPVSPYPMDENWGYLEPTSVEGKQSRHLRYIYELEDSINLAFLYIDDFDGLKISIVDTDVSD